MRNEVASQATYAPPVDGPAWDEYAPLFDLAPVGYVAFDFAASVVRANREASRLLGVEHGRLLGRSFNDFVEPSQRGLFLDHVTASILTGARTRTEIDLHAADSLARRVRLESAAFAPRMAARPALALTVLIDVTESSCAQRERERRERCQQQLLRMDALCDLAGGVAHDLNNLLTVILGNASFPTGDGTVLSVEARFSEIAQAAVRAANFCSDLSVATMRRPRVRTPVDLRTLVMDETVRLERDVGTAQHSSLCMSDEALVIAGDATQLAQTLRDLIGNAREAYARGDGPVTIRVFRARATERTLPEINFGGQLTPGEYVVLEVSDRGVGMSPATRDRMFDPFFSGKGRGRGLGLARVCGAARAHAAGGAVDSAPGRGTSIALWFPALSSVSEARSACSC